MSRCQDSIRGALQSIPNPSRRRAGLHDCLFDCLSSPSSLVSVCHFRTTRAKDQGPNREISLAGLVRKLRASMTDGSRQLVTA